MARTMEVGFADGERWPALGLGTWRLGESPARFGDEVASLGLALELGVRVFDTAEMYGDGGAERVLGRALAEGMRGGLPRDELFVVSKVLPEHARAPDVVAACERSCERLGLERIDLYLLHWRGSVALARTLEGFETLVQRGRIRRWGVSNFDVGDLREVAALRGGDGCSANQVLYSLAERGAGGELLGWQRRHAMPLMAYCPIDQGALGRHAGLRALGARLGATPAQLALAWLLTQPGVMAIPKASDPRHLRENLAALRIALDDAARAEIDRLFPPPRRGAPLAMR